jgi:nucleoside-triphosphatase THEP1
MPADRLLILVTGGIGCGKTRLLQRLRHALAERWRVGGLLAPAEGPARVRGEPAPAYRLELAGQAASLPWATRRASGAGFTFDPDTCRRATETVRSQLASGPFDVFLVDEIGPLELAGGGFAPLLRDVLASETRAVVAAVRPGLLATVVEAFGLEGALIVDLEATSPEQAERTCLRRIQATDAERIGAYAGIGGLVEVGLGSTLHAWRVPFKGHFLAYLQGVLLTTFGKPLRGRGLVRIAFISAMLKAFSPIGATFKPMAYIFVQGATFALPVWLLGWNLPAVLLGSVLMAWLTLALALAVDYVTFGQSVFDAFSGAIATVTAWLGVREVSLAQVLVALFVIKGLLALGLGATAFLGDLRPLVERLRRSHASRTRRARGAPLREERRSLARSAQDALGDLLRPRLLVLFFASILLILAFANLSKTDAAILVVRGLCVSYVGLLAARRLDVAALGRRLDRRFGLGLAESLPVAMKALGRPEGRAAEPE